MNLTIPKDFGSRHFDSRSRKPFQSFSKMDGSAFVALYRQYIVPGLSMDDGDITICLRLVASFLHVLKQRVQRMLRHHAHMPLLFSYQNDGWSSFISSYRTRRSGDVSLRAASREKVEFCFERGFVRAKPTASCPELAFLFGPPRAMLHGRGAWEFVGAGLDFSDTLRSMGHEGPSVSVYVFDGALFDALAPKFRARHELYYSDKYGICTGHKKSDLRNSDLCFPIYCSLHGGHKGAEWGVMPYNTCEESSEAHIVIRSLLNSSRVLHDGISPFLQRYVSFEERSLPEDEVLSYWRFFEVPKKKCLCPLSCLTLGGVLVRSNCL